MIADSGRGSCSFGTVVEGEQLSRVEDPRLRQTAFAIEQMTPGGTERPDCGCVRHEDLTRGINRLRDLLSRPAGQKNGKRRALEQLLERSHDLENLLEDEQTAGVVYLAEAEYDLPSRLRSAAIEIDFSFGDRDGAVSESDIKKARRHYGVVRGPVGWNRLLLTDEIERRLFPERTLKTTVGRRLLPRDWLSGTSDPLARLRKVSQHLDDQALARTYADIAARLATVAAEDPREDLRRLFEAALALLGQQILQRNSVRPSITDIARIGCEDPEVKALLKSPIEMSRRLQPQSLIDRYLAQ